jgi:DNA polymerase III epsilon subunit-like protein
MPLCFLDTETTGLSAEKHEILSVAIVTENEDGTVERWESKVAPRRIEAAHPKALEVNGYTEQGWADAPDMVEVAPIVAAKLDGAIVIGHNVNFDIRFVEAMFAEAGIDQEINHRGIVDTVTLAREHLKPTGLKSVSLDNCRRWLGWSMAGAHEALQDADDARRLYHTLCRASGFQRMVWKFFGPIRMKMAK